MLWTRPCAAIAGTALLATSALAESPAGIVVHMTEADFSQGGCPLLVDEELACESIEPIGDGSVEQFAWLIAYGWDSLEGWGDESVGLGGVTLGVTYPPETQVLGWVSCADFAIPLDDQLIGTWPESDTGIALVFSGSNGYDPTSGFATLGFLRIEAGSSGRLAVTRHAAAQVDAVQFVSSDDTTFEIPVEGFSSADIGGDVVSNGERTCESAIPTVETSWSRIKTLF
jgi:hypothetical protein